MFLTVRQQIIIIIIYCMQFDEEIKYLRIQKYFQLLFIVKKLFNQDTMEKVLLVCV